MKKRFTVAVLIAFMMMGTGKVLEAWGDSCYSTLEQETYKAQDTYATCVNQMSDKGRLDAASAGPAGPGPEGTRCVFEFTSNIAEATSKYFGCVSLGSLAAWFGLAK